MARERLRSQSVKNISAFIHDIYSSRNADAFTSHLVSALSRLVPADAYSYNELNPAQHRAVYKYAPNNFTVVPQGMEILSRFIHQHPHVQYVAATGDGSPHTITDFVSLRQFKKTDLYQEFYRPMRIPYNLAADVCDRDSSGTAVTLGMHRGSRDFCEQDRSVLSFIRPHIRQAFTNAQLVTRLEAQCAALKHAMEEATLGILTLTSHHTILWGTSRALALMELCAGWNERYPDQLPLAVFDWVRRIDCAMDSSQKLPTAPTSLEIDCGSQRVRLRLLRKDGHRTLVLEETGTTVTPERLSLLGLSKREMEVLAWAAQGKGNEDIGCILGCQLRTVKKHLERIYIKLGVENRTAAAILAIETARMARITYSEVTRLKRPCAIRGYSDSFRD
jgi:DNA-binding CsgD family transcriptional regulator